MKKTVFIIAVLALFLSSCGYFMGKRVRGNGHWTTDSRTVSSFSSVEVSGAIDIMVQQGPLAPVRIEADENILPYVEVYTEGDQLIVRSKRGYNLRPSQKMKVLVTAPTYHSIEVSGACNINGENKIENPDDIRLEVSGAGDINMDLNAPRIDVHVSGSGSVNLKGETRDFSVDLSGAGKVRCYDLKTENTKLEISGAGSAEVFASVSLDASVSGAGSVSYKGNAPKVNQHVSGAGSISKAD